MLVTGGRKGALYTWPVPDGPKAMSLESPSKTTAKKQKTSAQASQCQVGHRISPMPHVFCNSWLGIMAAWQLCGCPVHRT